MASAPFTVYRMAVCLYNGVTSLDYQGPVELLALRSTPIRKMFPDLLGANETNCAIDATYLANTLDPIVPLAGPKVLPDQTYDDAKEQFDIIFIPGGACSVRKGTEHSLMNFLKRQGPHVKYILAVCTGSWILSSTGLLDGKRATSNKAMFKAIQEDTKDLPITWIAKARWVATEDKKIWSSSGITAGTDLAYAFLEHITGKGPAEASAGLLEMMVKGEGDDPFAAKYGLV
ncbi:class I glutamine amidotransferase-like protein [Guyanagaster necrorhizus]|uniref:Class I glutamine amidotransferase-like protein n=1 Tax=Guyanagaster necrorhizus TaxID=856835 RepID=A0A9P7VYM3_9AGAR|nr:class I glutamine amidotransferase-like protein [Guyanagaster necrorhizus MCA 3950]KAG7448226.1 class I glutamine amidotransferase-like protein [Guyanagaster necrorhizus MCA 3950]